MKKVWVGSRKGLKRNPDELLLRYQTEKLIIDSVADTMGVLDKEGNILYFNKGYENIEHIVRDFTGMDISEGDNIFEIIKNVKFSSVEVYKALASGLSSVIKGSGELFQHEYYWDSNQERRWFELMVKPLSQREKGSLITLVDITRRKNAENQIIESKSRYRRLMENLPDAVLIIIGDEIVYVNQVGCRMFGYETNKDFIGKSIFKFLHSDYHEITRERIHIVQKEQGKVPLVEERIITSQGKVLDVEVSSIRYIYDDKPASMVVFRDITERKQSEILRRSMEENARLLTQAYEYDKLKNEFIVNVSHELRTPINVILSGLQLLEIILKEESKDNIRTRSNKYRNMMKQNCYRLLRLINNLVDISKIEAGFFELNLKNYNIVSIVEDVCMSVVDYIEGHGLQLEFDTEFEEKIVACDPDKIERVMLNLLSNAVKFTQIGGKISVNIYDRNGSIEIRVRDTGIGIPEEKKELLFQRFRQINPSLIRNNQGSGIGLSLVKSLIELHLGSIYAESKYGDGTEFVITLPVSILEEGVSSFDDTQDCDSKIERINIEFSDVYSL